MCNDLLMTDDEGVIITLLINTYNWFTAIYNDTKNHKKSLYPGRAGVTINNKKSFYVIW